MKHLSDTSAIMNRMGGPLQIIYATTSRWRYGPLARHVKLRVAHAPGMPGTFSSQPRFSYPDMHHGSCVTHLPWCIPGSLTSGFLWSRWWGKRSRHSRRMRNPQFHVSGKRPMAWHFFRITGPLCGALVSNLYIVSLNKLLSKESICC